MISVIIPTLNAQAGLPRCFAALVPAVIDGLIREVIVVDGGSTDLTEKIADEAGATFVTAAPGRGNQLAAGAAIARQPFMLFLHADTVLEPGFENAVRQFISTAFAQQQAGYFKLAFDDMSASARRLEWMVALRCALFRLPYGDQGLLISRTLYSQIGGYLNIPLMEDVAMARTLGRRLVPLRAIATTSAMRYVTRGYFAQSMRNLGLLMLYLLGASPHRLARLYR
jgi:rSAM/selenodomain-associated transferase 2